MTETEPDFAEYKSIVTLIEQAVLAAAEYLAGELASGRKPQVWLKPDNSMVMNLDIECQKRVLNVLGKDVPIVAEEDEKSHNLIETEGSYFLVDPLDGTTSCRRFMGELGGHVGYGPLVGYVDQHKLTAAAFYSVPHHKLFTAVRGKGCFVVDVSFPLQREKLAYRRLKVAECAGLDNAGFLYFFGKRGEAFVMQKLRDADAIENLYRFGGFANDCARIAQSFEQATVQFNVKPWDFSAVLLCAEAGSSIWIPEIPSLDSRSSMLPLKRGTAFSEWRIRSNNPVLILHPNIVEQFFALVGQNS